MPLDRFLLVLVCVAAAAGVTIGAAALAGGLGWMSEAWPVLLPVALIAAFLVRVVVQWRNDPHDRRGRR